MKKIIKNFYWTFLKRKNFSQGLEEKFILDYFKKNNGFYIDVGSHDPFRFSNTSLLYKRGWKGVNIDANEETISRFNKFRKRDINIRALISDKIKELEYYYLNDHALNGVLEKPRLEKLLNLNYKIIKKEKFQTITLDKILEKITHPLALIDFLNIDVEGKELDVLKSIDLNKYKVKIIMVEQNDKLNKIENYLSKFNYKLIETIDRNLVFEKN